PVPCNSFSPCPNHAQNKKISVPEKKGVDNSGALCYYMGVNDNHSHQGGANGKNGKTLSQA
ncbi:MAG: hypothetical protein IJ938_03430, partial [Clostridia bacterium]|nr:hypothetical protein [Clostridia bacterium]